MNAAKASPGSMPIYGTVLRVKILLTSIPSIRVVSTSTAELEIRVARLVETDDASIHYLLVFSQMNLDL